MTLKEAIQQRIPRVRRPMWAHADSYLRLPLLSPPPAAGVWAELYDDWTQEEVVHVRPGSQRLCVPLELDGVWDFEPYTGVVSPHEQNVANFARGYSEV